MCTLTFVPGLPLGGYLIAHNRDEANARGPGLPPRVERFGDATVMAPRDSDAGGTWIGVDDRGRCLAILNGDGVAAAPAPADARSRGLLVAELLADARPAAVRARLQRLVADGALRSRPFKLVAVEPVVRADVVGASGLSAAPPQATLLRLDWDGARLAEAELSGPQCLVSSTFESGAVAAERGEAFARLLDSLPRDEDRLRARRAAAMAVPEDSSGPGAQGPAGTQSAAGARDAEARDAAGARRAADARCATVDLGWITDPEPVAAALRAFHAGHSAAAPAGDAFSVCMHRPDGRTVSRTLVLVGPREIRMEYVPGSPCLGAEPVVTALERRVG
ncbi:MAG TPA: NRDE family protein [Planctomycetota bacterium]|nr:NRDE family protein [Planctomycetota bacterium]